MSYRPPTPPAGIPPQRSGGPGYVSPGRVREAQKRGIPWLMGCGLMFLGFVIGLVVLTFAALFYFGSPVSSDPLPRRQQPVGVPDLSATISESYLNSEIAKELKANSPSLAGIVSVKDIVVKILPNEQLEVAARVGNALVDFDVNVTESISVINGQIAIKAVGQPKVGKGNLPIDVNSVVQGINNLVVEPQINKNVASVKVNDRVLKLIDLQTAAALVTVRYRAQ